MLRAQAGENLYVAVITPLEELLAPVVASNLHSLMISLLVILAAIPLVGVYRLAHGRALAGGSKGD